MAAGNLPPLFVPSSAQLGLTYLVSEVLLAVLKRSREGAGSTQDRGSLRVLWIIIGLSIFAGIWIAQNWRSTDLPHHYSLAVAGAAIFLLGVILRWWAIVHLGRFFTVDVAIAKDHQLVDSGPYRFVRHPSYTGALIAFFGFGLSLGNWAALLAVMLPICGAFLYRINVEERALSAGLGESYRAYARRTKRLIPLVY